MSPSSRQKKLTDEDRPFDLRNCVKQAVERYTDKALKKGLRLHWEVAPQLSAQMIGDPDRLGQILMKLIGNAVKFTANNGEISLTVAKEADGVYFKVCDSGIGIPPERMERIFEPFTQGDNSMTRRYGGAGLGLAISKNLVEMMGGAIWVESVLGQGSTFIFSLPLSFCVEP